MADLHMESLSDHELAEVADQALASLNARFGERDEVQLSYPSLCGDCADELATALRRACDEWDRFADLLPGFRT